MPHNVMTSRILKKTIWSMSKLPQCNNSSACYTYCMASHTTISARLDLQIFTCRVCETDNLNNISCLFYMYFPRSPSLSLSLSISLHIHTFIHSRSHVGSRQTRSTEPALVIALSGESSFPATSFVPDAADGTRA